MKSAGRRKARCPHCRTNVELDDRLEVWDTITCDECSTVLQLVKISPPTLDYFLEEEPDYDDDDLDFDDDEYGYFDDDDFDDDDLDYLEDDDIDDEW